MCVMRGVRGIDRRRDSGLWTGRLRWASRMCSRRTLSDLEDCPARWRRQFRSRCGWHDSANDHTPSAVQGNHQVRCSGSFQPLSFLPLHKCGAECRTHARMDATASRRDSVARKQFALAMGNSDRVGRASEFKLWIELCLGGWSDNQHAVVSPVWPRLRRHLVRSRFRCLPECSLLPIKHQSVWHLLGQSPLVV